MNNSHKKAGRASSHRPSSKRKGSSSSRGFSKKLKMTLYSLAVLVFIVMILVGTIGMGSCVKRRTEIFIPTGSTYAQVKQMLKESGNIRMLHFEVLAQIKTYPVLVKPGRYVLQRGSTALQVVNKLRSGDQDEIKLVFNKVRTLEQLAGVVARQIEADSLSVIKLLRDDEYLSRYTYPKLEVSDLEEAKLLPFNQQSIISCFIPNTYYLFWNTNAEDFLKRMMYEQDNYWNEFRRGQAKALGMNRVEVMTVASIVEEETNKVDERDDVASVYLNRLRKGMKLQADPTVKFAVGDFGLRRILREHLQVESPYNTYRNKGLPPGPICTPSVSSIEAVLENKPTDYLYFCARADFSGYHAFARNYTQHMANARAYQRELNRRGIR